MKKCFNASAVIGLGFGDEGKGTTTHYLASTTKADLVVRYSGGQQAGHTVMANGVKHTFSNFGSGTLAGVPTYWSRFCTVDPVGLANERKILAEKGVTPKLFVDARCPVTTPWDKLFNQKIDNAHGTCGVGVGTTFAREELKRSLLVEDLLSSSVAQIKLGLIESYYRTCGVEASDELVQQFYDGVVTMLQTVDVVDDMPYHEHVVFESSQGLLLDQDVGFFPHVTRSSVGMKNVDLLAGIDVGVLAVTRAFQTRHGNGPMTNLDKPHNIKDNQHEINVTNRWQGEFRRSLLDVDLLSYGFKKEGLQHRKHVALVVTCMDLVESEYRFTHQGQVVYAKDADDFARAIADRLGVQRVITSDNPYSNFKTVR